MISLLFSRFNFVLIFSIYLSTVLWDIFNSRADSFAVNPLAVNLRHSISLPVNFSKSTEWFNCVLTCFMIFLPSAR